MQISQIPNKMAKVFQLSGRLDGRAANELSTSGTGTRLDAPSKLVIDPDRFAHVNSRELQVLSCRWEDPRAVNTRTASGSSQSHVGEEIDISDLTNITAIFSDRYQAVNSTLQQGTDRHAPAP